MILVEGQTEERFVKDVLYPEFVPRSLYLYPTILTTRVVKSGSDFKGGITTYAKLRGDLCKLLNDTGALVTTMIDYYGLPADFPGMSTRPKGSAIDRVRHVERSIFLDVGSPRHLTPFLLLHEFEALLFTNTEVTASTIPARDRAPELLAVARGQAPEDINEDPATAPSKRIKQVFPSFKKTLHGPTAAKRIGLPAIRACCPHFDAWLTRLEDFATS